MNTEKVKYRSSGWLSRKGETKVFPKWIYLVSVCRWGSPEGLRLDL